MLTVPLNVTTDPQSGETVKVKVGEEYRISCNVTGDEAPTDNPWLHSDKTKVKNDTEAGVTVIIAPLQDTIGINSTITFTKVTKEQLGDYICSAGDGKPSATVTLKEAGKWNVQFGLFCCILQSHVWYTYVHICIGKENHIFSFPQSLYLLTNFTSSHLKFIQSSSDFNWSLMNSQQLRYLDYCSRILI